jgi:hypothetical protein
MMTAHVPSFVSSEHRHGCRMAPCAEDVAAILPLLRAVAFGDAPTELVARVASGARAARMRARGPFASSAPALRSGDDPDRRFDRKMFADRRRHAFGTAARRNGWLSIS